MPPSTEHIALALRPSDEARPRQRSVDEPAGLSRLIERAREGDGAAFEQLFEAYKDYVYSVAYYLTGDVDLAAEAVQEVFLKLWRRLDRFHGRSRWTTWLYRVVHNTVYDVLRRRRPEVSLEEGVVAERAAVEPDSPIRRQSARIVRAAVARLSPKLRAVVVLRFVAGLSYEEIAGALGVSRGTVASRLSRALERLAAEVPRDEVEVP